MSDNITKPLSKTKIELDNILLLCNMAEASIEQNRFENCWDYYPIFGMIKLICKKAILNIKKIDF